MLPKRLTSRSRLRKSHTGGGAIAPATRPLASNAGLAFDVTSPSESATNCKNMVKLKRLFLCSFNNNPVTADVASA